MTATEFWQTLDNNCWAYLGPPGDRIDPATIPTTVKELRDDPYRTLAWRVVKKHGYCKTDVPFAEFKWAAYFRAKGIQPDQTNRAMKAAESCATSGEDGLPGCKAAGSSCPRDDED